MDCWWIFYLKKEFRSNIFPIYVCFLNNFDYVKKNEGSFVIGNQYIFGTRQLVKNK